MGKKTVLFALTKPLLERLFFGEDIQRIRAACDVADVPVPEAADKPFVLAHVGGANIAITSWGTARFDDDVMAKADALEMVNYAAGSVKPIVSDALWKRGVRVTSGAGAIAYGVAETCVGYILTVPKRLHWAALNTAAGGWKLPDAFGPAFEIYRQKIGVIGAGHIGRLVIGMLHAFDCDVLVYDPYLTADAAADLGATKAETLEEIFSQCRVVTLNAPTTDETRGMLRGEHFAMLAPGSVFINTARNEVINEPEFIDALRKARFVACLDVTGPVEPPPADHPYRTLGNVLLTPHVAGCFAENSRRIGKFVADAIEAFVAGEPLRFEVTEAMLATIA